MKCRHLFEPAQSFRRDVESGEETTLVFPLCGWADAHPERLVDAPRWLVAPALAGGLVHPERDCAGCPGFSAERTGR